MYNFSNLKKGETLVSIIVWVVILGIAIGGVTMILLQNRTIEEDYNKNNTVSILQSNAENILRKVDTSKFVENDVFSIYKDPVSKIFQAFSGTLMEQYRYIDQNGDSVTSTGSYQGTLYTRIFRVEQWDSLLDGKPRHLIVWEVKELIRK